MVYQDKLYGKFKIEEPVILALLNSKPILRLKKINQHGASCYLFSWKTKTTRFDHSLGVMFLLRQFRASLEEQVAGLLHDLSHTAFSHVVDFVFPSKTHNFHEKHFRRLILNSEIPRILKKYQLSQEKILNAANFPLLERKLPDLCADRIDYFLRHLFDMKKDLSRINFHIRNLKVYHHEFIFKEIKAAYAFALDYLKQDRCAWANPKEIAAYQVLAEAIKIGLKEGILKQEDLFTDDKTVMGKLKNSNHFQIKRLIALLNPNFEIKIDRKNYDYHLKAKLRFIDPKVLIGGELKKISTLLPVFRKKLEYHQKRIKKGFFVKIVDFRTQIEH